VLQLAGTEGKPEAVLDMTCPLLHVEATVCEQ